MVEGNGSTLLLPRSSKDHKKYDGDMIADRSPLVILKAYARQLLQSPSRTALYLFVGSMATWLILFRPFDEGEQPISFLSSKDISAPEKDASNWGDWVAQGKGRQKMLESSHPDFHGLGDDYKVIGLGDSSEIFYNAVGQAHRARRPIAGLHFSSDATFDAKRFNEERHGTFGGQHVEWDSGIAGLGEYLGSVDMRKISALSPAQKERLQSKGVETEKWSAGPDIEARHKAAVAHHLENAWTYGKVEEELAVAKRLADAKTPAELKKLPVYERMATASPDKKAAVAEGWARIYGAFAGDGKKSALHASIEKLVRRSPIVVFSKTTCPYSARAKASLANLKLSPPPTIIEVDLRPDSANLKSLLGRLTLHNTFPNIIIGSRSIGGSDDLQALLSSGQFQSLVAEVNVSME
ncbi:uncharacterized protein L969DRAFT_311008 [Mixia osmundae IAM 14324]|uniref:Glutaredoxin domain-containing protein n=1 Tax=Mixia osmundae (strain CBS 9802 / IAM 14324 / JCM 22182 / KY 12970) TaxID=764103 RepID=G7DYC1_MIXOS|nr:uncharacterized protein L969DRAFT_311008 [Mixia osmundae IAM 14324]KEI41484.1 hypothetical protein L969DRAFT_311008 [Mixia osmundae IAM 14324]GAA95581.1 hypothetical protein E5Q_02237 [Mixia osmundae IAM 14324]